MTTLDSQRKREKSCAVVAASHLTSNRVSWQLLREFEVISLSLHFFLPRVLVRLIRLILTFFSPTFMSTFKSWTLHSHLKKPLDLG